jgi:uncharacterized protein (TIGR03435 family)
MRSHVPLMIFALCGTVWAQDPGMPAFTASPIRPTPDPTNRSTRMTPTGLQMNGGTIRQIWQLVYPNDGGDPIGAPDWLSTERFDLTIRFETVPTTEQRQVAMRQIFAEQLKLKVHYETRPTPTYDLVIARPDRRLGPTVKRLPFDCDALRTSAIEAAGRGEKAAPPPPASNGTQACATDVGAGRYVSGGVTLAQLAGNLRTVAGRLTVDKTGLAGFYEFALEWAPAGPPSPDGPPDSRPNIFTALQEQLGLKLEPSTTPVQFVVIDHIEHPTGK